MEKIQFGLMLVVAIFGFFYVQSLPTGANENCDPKEISTEVKVDGCSDQKVYILGCSGYCNSYFVPNQTQECRACLETGRISYTVTFNCVHRDNTVVSRTAQLENVTGCACQNVECLRRKR